MMRARGWDQQLAAALESARAAGKKLQTQFGTRSVRRYKGSHDVQLSADLEAHRIIRDSLTDAFPGYGLVSEEEPHGRWPNRDLVWVIDPLDGTNNFGYGIGHCAIAIALFQHERVVLAVVVDPLLNREFFAVEGGSLAHPAQQEVPLHHATISLVTNYSADGRAWGEHMGELLGARCKRTLSLWAPSLDLALISAGAMDGMICYQGNLLDVCGGVFLVSSSGGCVLDLSGRPLRIRGSMHNSPVSFVAARTRRLADELLHFARSASERKRKAAGVR